MGEEGTLHLLVRMWKGYDVNTMMLILRTKNQSGVLLRLF